MVRTVVSASFRPQQMDPLMLPAFAVTDDAPFSFKGSYWSGHSDSFSHFCKELPVSFWRVPLSPSSQLGVWYESRGECPQVVELFYRSRGL